MQFGNVAERTTVTIIATVKGAASLHGALCTLTYTRVANGAATNKPSSTIATPTPTAAPAVTSYFDASGGLEGLDAAIALLLDVGKMPDAAQVNEASAHCGPPSADLSTGSDVQCGINCSVGPVAVIVAVTAEDARQFSFVALRSDLGTPSGAAGAAAAACQSGPVNSCAPDPAAIQCNAKPFGGGAVPAPGQPGVMPCLGSPVEWSTEVVFACADLNSLVNNITWSSWTPESATGVGTLAENDCTPDCAGGKDLSFAITIQLTKAKAADYGVLYTSATLTAKTQLAFVKSDTQTIALNLAVGD